MNYHQLNQYLFNNLWYGEPIILTEDEKALLYDTGRFSK